MVTDKVQLVQLAILPGVPQLCPSEFYLYSVQIFMRYLGFETLFVVFEC